VGGPPRRARIRQCARAEGQGRDNLRDLPRGAGDHSGARFTEADQKGNWLDFTKWAWNENWIGFDDPRPFVTTSATATPVPAETITRICREVLVDNVRGQAPEWEPSAIREATLTKRKLSSSKGITEIEYKGRVSMKEEGRAYEAELYGRGEWVEAKGEFRKLDIVAIGDRSGASRHNQRERDPGPAPMGIALSLFRE
jgi:hypothetical protein